MSRCYNEELICENGGSCWDKADGSSECVCFGGYYGDQCEFDPDDNQGKKSIFYNFFERGLISLVYSQADFSKRFIFM